MKAKEKKLMIAFFILIVLVMLALLEPEAKLLDLGAQLRDLAHPLGDVRRLGAACPQLLGKLADLSLAERRRVAVVHLAVTDVHSESFFYYLYVFIEVSENHRSFCGISYLHLFLLHKASLSTPRQIPQSVRYFQYIEQYS